MAGMSTQRLRRLGQPAWWSRGFLAGSGSGKGKGQRGAFRRDMKDNMDIELNTS